MLSSLKEWGGKRGGGSGNMWHADQEREVGGRHNRGI